MTNMIFFSLTPEEVQLPLNEEEEQEPYPWLDDSECQENLAHILSLTPEESIIDKDNHILSFCQLFFKELGYLTEEPEPIDPSRDYEQEARDLSTQRDRKLRQKHVDLSPTPSLESHSRSGLSSSSSSIHHEHHLDVRSPYHLGVYHANDHTLPHHYGHLDHKHYTPLHRQSRIH
ncbi:hypothetical protein BD560DRAFT_383358 [Blakeslea trispora]|nr:hypothetical protein BD560DRAFT_383358 [Blakeslea trispora]